MTLRKYLATIATLMMFGQLNAQELTERVLITDSSQDSVLLKAFRAGFDSAGNYYFETLLKGKSEKFALRTNTKRYDAAIWSNAIAFAPYKALITNAFYTDSTKRELVYKNKLGTQLYGPVQGRVREVLEYGREHIALEVCIGAKSYLYIDNKLVNAIDSQKQQWLCGFSDNGHVIYTIYKDNTYQLYLNHVLIDKSDQPFTDIEVNNNKQYIYAKKESGKSVFVMSGKKFGPLDAIEHSDLLNDNGYYCYGCYQGNCYVLVNGQLYDKIKEPFSLQEDAGGNEVMKSDAQITVRTCGPSNYVYMYTQDGANSYCINKNGILTPRDYYYVGELTTDNACNYAFYAARRDSVHKYERTYKNVNGKEVAIKPFKKKAVFRFVPLQLSADGTSTYFFQTKDSVYLYRNDAPFQPPASAKRFAAWDASILPNCNPTGKHYFGGINIEGSTYVLYNNTISKPLPLAYLAYDRFDQPQKGSIVAGDFNDAGYYLIQYLGDGKYQLVINNRVYKELSGIDYIYGNQGYLCEGKLIFYGVKGKNVCQFTLNY